MNLFTALFLILLSAVLSVNAQPLRKTDWSIIMGNATTDGYSYPRVASFKSGSYAVIFGYSASKYTSVTQIRVYMSTGGYKSFETQYPSNIPDTTYVGPMTAQNVFVFPDGKALGVWQMRGDVVCMGTSFSESGVISTDVIFQSAVGRWNAIDYLDIAGTSLNYAIAHSGVTNISNILFLAQASTGGKSWGSPQESAVIHLTASIKGSNPVIFSFIVFPDVGSPNSGTYYIQATSVNGTVTKLEALTDNAVKAIPFVVDAFQIVAGLFVRSDGVIQLRAFNSTTLQFLYQLDVASNADIKFAPNVIQNRNQVLVAFSTTSNRINYQMVKILTATAVLLGPEITHDVPSTTTSVSMANTVGSDIVVVAKDVTGTQVLSRTITFCGNGEVNLQEECDGIVNCNSNCTCIAGTAPLIGLDQAKGGCYDKCNNGIVTGNEECDSGANCTDCKCDTGYQPMTPRAQGCQPIPTDFVPNVRARFNCLDIIQTGLVLYFNFDNFDGYNQTIPYGPFNTFIPAEWARETPKFFPAGQSLSYPAWQYSLLLPNTTQFFTWILGSNNLTVDLSDPYALQCPKDLSVDVTLSTFGNLTDDLVQRLLENIADRYNVSESRLSATYQLQSTDAQGINTYLVVVTIGSTTALEETPSDVVTDILNDIQNLKEELALELTEGLEEANPVIKAVTPSIIETRGTSTPVSVFTPQIVAQMSATSIIGIESILICLLIIALML